MNYIVSTKVAEGALPPAVLELLGLPDGARLLSAGAAAFSWTVEEDGDGIGVARSATRGGLECQVQRLLNLTNEGRRLRTIVVAPNMCGNRRFHERPDLLEVDDAVKVGWCRFVAVTDMDRISREADVGTLFVEYLCEEGVELILASRSSAPVDLDPLSLEMQLMFLTPSSEHERLRAAFRRLGHRDS
jgi:hypothetical protein